MQTPFSRKKYKVLSPSYSTRTWKQTFITWWKWDILPYFKKLYYIYSQLDKKFYAWQMPFVKNSIRYIAMGKDGKIKKSKDKWYQFIR